MKNNYIAQWRYRSDFGGFNEGDVLRLTEEEAEIFNRDSPGVLLLAEESVESPDTVEGRAESGPPLDRMVRAEDVDTREIDASPAAEKLAEELGVNLADVKGTGKDGKITVTDVRKYAE